MIPNTIINDDAELVFAFSFIHIRRERLSRLINDVLEIIQFEEICGIFIRPERKWIPISQVNEIYTLLNVNKEKIAVFSIIGFWNKRVLDIYIEGLRTTDYSIRLLAYSDHWNLESLSLADKKAINSLLRALDEKLLPQRKGFECEVPDVSPYIGKTGFLLFED